LLNLVKSMGMRSAAARMAERTTTTETDEELIRRVAEGHPTALADLYRRYARSVAVVMGRIAPEMSFAEREELVQEAFLDLSEGAARFRADAAFRPWIYGIAVKSARRWRRDTWLRRNLLRRYPEQMVGMALSTDGTPETRAEHREAIARAVESLPAGLRDVIVLTAIEGFSGEEAAAILGIDHRAVRTRLHRARLRMLERLRRDDGIVGGRGNEA
jgi:RNA polymerase sigma factor (sigma-70 family)